MANGDEKNPSKEVFGSGPANGMGGRTGFFVGLAILIGIAATGVYLWATLPAPPETPPHSAVSLAPKTP
jgi:hypothetical protein